MIPVNIEEAIAEYGLTMEIYEDCLRDIFDKKEGNNDLEWKDIINKYDLPLSETTLRKACSTIFGGKFVYEFLTKQDDYKTVDQRILCISDAHIPFNLPVSIYKNYSRRVDTIIVNGDLLDCFSCSSYPKKFKVNLDEELILGREYISELIELIRPKKIVFIMGNHEYRMQRYVSDKLTNELFSVIPTDPLGMIINDGFDVNDARNKIKTFYCSIRDMYADMDLEIIYDADWWYKEGNVIFAHPLSYSSGMLKTTEKAMNFFLHTDRTFTGLVLGHTHKIGSFVQGGIKMYEQGCVCDLDKLDYNNGKLVIPNQNGYMYICLDNSGNIIDDKTKLVTF